MLHLAFTHTQHVELNTLLTVLNADCEILDILSLTTVSLKSPLAFDKDEKRNRKILLNFFHMTGHR